MAVAQFIGAIPPRGKMQVGAIPPGPAASEAATGSADLSLAFSLDASASAVATGDSFLALTLGLSAAGLPIATGAADLAIAFGVSATGQPVAAGSSDLALSLGGAVAGHAVAVGAADVALALGLTVDASAVATTSPGLALSLDISASGSAVVASTGLAASFTAANSEYLSKSDTSVDTGGKSYAIAFWVYVNALGSQEFFVAKYQGLSTGEFYVGKDTSDRIIWRLVGNSNFYDLVTTGTTLSQGWNFLALTYDNTTKVMSASLNGGTFVNRAAFSDSPKSNATPPLILGAQTASTGFLTGRLQSLGIWTGRTLSSGEVADLYNSGDGVLYGQLPSGLLTGFTTLNYYDLGEESDGSGPVTRLDSHGTDHLTDNNTVPSADGIVSGENVAEGAADFAFALGLSADGVAVASASASLSLAIDAAAAGTVVPTASASLELAAGIDADGHAVAIAAADLAIGFGLTATASPVAIGEVAFAFALVVDATGQVGSVAVGPTQFASTAEPIGPDPYRATAAALGPDPARSTAVPA